MKQTITIMLIGLIGLSCAAVTAEAFSDARGSAANTPNGGYGSTNTTTIDKRQVQQEKRIQQGLKSGQLTPEEAAKLEKQQQHIRKAEQAARSDGTITDQERRKLHKMQDNASDTIARKKHNQRKIQSAH